MIAHTVSSPASFTPLSLLLSNWHWISTEAFPDTPNWQPGISGLVVLLSHVTLHKRWHFRLSRLFGHRAISVRAEWLELPFPEPCLVNSTQITQRTFLLSHLEGEPALSQAESIASSWYIKLFGLWLLYFLNWGVESGEKWLQTEHTLSDSLFLELISKKGVSPVEELTIFLKEAPWKCLWNELMQKTSTSTKKQIPERKCDVSKVLHTFSCLAKK